jgi:hypothetical protein
MKSEKIAQLGILLVLVSFFTSGCAQVMVLKHPRPFKPTTLVQGTKRVVIVGELGQPQATEEHSNTLTDVYKYSDGGDKNNGASKTGRIIIYSAGDIFTLFLDQVIWIPMEEYGFAPIDHRVTVDYAKSQDDYWCAVAINDVALNQSSRSSSTNRTSNIRPQTGRR